jgi:peptidoglycan/xylan/chitin deacetylase (PgdA/CDA1 family)
MLTRIKYFFITYLLPERLFLLRKSSADNALYLTFDDGPVENIIEPLLTLLAQYQAKATFFVLGSRVAESPQLLTKISQANHTIANHSYTHPNFHQISHQQKCQEIEKTNQLITRITGKSCQFFRAPQGRWNIKIIGYLIKNSMVATHWSRDSLDFTKTSVDEIIERFKTQPVTAGDIILFHDDATLCIEALTRLIPLWQSQGFTLKALKEYT